MVKAKSPPYQLTQYRLCKGGRVQRNKIIGRKEVEVIVEEKRKKEETRTNKTVKRNAQITFEITSHYNQSVLILFIIIVSIRFSFVIIANKHP